MICPNCSRLIDHDSIFCKYCGCQVQAPKAQSQTKQPATASRQKTAVERYYAVFDGRTGEAVTCSTFAYTLCFAGPIAYECYPKYEGYLVKFNAVKDREESIDLAVYQDTDAFKDDRIEEISDNEYLLQIGWDELQKQNHVKIEIDTSYYVEMCGSYPSTLTVDIYLPDPPEISAERYGEMTYSDDVDLVYVQGEWRWEKSIASWD